MKRVPSIRVLTALVIGLGGLPGFRALAAEKEGVAVEIIYDTSGSMKSTVPNASGGSSPKYEIANRALIAVAKQLTAFAKDHPDATVEAGLIIFNGDNAREVEVLSAGSLGKLEPWAKTFSAPAGNTPLGKALSLAGDRLIESGQPRRHVLIITDGMNTVEPKPETVMPRLVRKAQAKNARLSVHFVAFDVNAKVFAPMKKFDATVVGAADEKQLNAQLDFILQKKILLEDEEPKTKPK